jgi:hypothetical protein
VRNNNCDITISARAGARVRFSVVVGGYLCNIHNIAMILDATMKKFVAKEL